MFRTVRECMQNGCVFDVTDSRRRFVCKRHNVAHVCQSYMSLHTCIRDDNICLISGLKWKRERKITTPIRQKNSNVRDIIDRRYSRPFFMESVREFVLGEEKKCTSVTHDKTMLNSNIVRTYYLLHLYKSRLEFKRLCPEALLERLDSMFLCICYAIMEDKAIDQRDKLRYVASIGRLKKLNGKFKGDLSKLITFDRVNPMKRIDLPLFEEEPCVMRQKYKLLAISAKP